MEEAHCSLNEGLQEDEGKRMRCRTGRGMICHYQHGKDDCKCHVQTIDVFDGNDLGGVDEGDGDVGVAVGVDTWSQMGHFQSFLGLSERVSHLWVSHMIQCTLNCLSPDQLEILNDLIHVDLLNRGWRSGGHWNEGT